MGYIMARDVRGKHVSSGQWVVLAPALLPPEEQANQELRGITLSLVPL